MGVVYRATDHVFGREVAVKVLKRKFADTAFVARFLSEARITGGLQHPGIPPCHDLGTLSDGRPFLAIKLVRGRTLAQHLKTVTMDWAAPEPEPAAHPGKHARAMRMVRKVRRKLREWLYWKIIPSWEGPTLAELTDTNPAGLLGVLGFFERICQTVAYAHSRGIIHRDLKTENVMIGDFGEVQVMDWGLAKNLAEQAPPGARAEDGLLEAHTPLPAEEEPVVQTLAGFPIGTPPYMPPEQARGELDRIDKRSDVFALGAVLCELLTGKPPYVGTPSEVITQAKAGDLKGALGRLRAARVGKELVTLVKRCLAADPADRPEDGNAVCGAVTAYLSGFTDRLKKAQLAKADKEARESERRTALGTIAMAIGSVIFVLALIVKAVHTARSVGLTDLSPAHGVSISPTSDVERLEKRLEKIRSRLRLAGRTGEMLARQPDNVLLEIESDLKAADYVFLSLVLKRLDKREAEKQGQPKADKPVPPKVAPRK
jgi:serine/threonine protein kinase